MLTIAPSRIRFLEFLVAVITHRQQETPSGRDTMPSAAVACLAEPRRSLPSELTERRGTSTTHPRKERHPRGVAAVGTDRSRVEFSPSISCLTLRRVARHRPQDPKDRGGPISAPNGHWPTSTDHAAAAAAAAKAPLPLAVCTERWKWPLLFSERCD